MRVIGKTEEVEMEVRQFHFSFFSFISSAAHLLFVILSTYDRCPSFMLEKKIPRTRRKRRQRRSEIAVPVGVAGGGSEMGWAHSQEMAKEGRKRE